MALKQPSEHQPSLLTSACSQNEAVERLEAQVDEGLQVLTSIEGILRKYAGDHDDAWIKQLENVQRKATKPNVVIGVLGSTGTGKSSIINALLDEERVVPTNPVRACTAVVTEISYNHDNAFRYHAEIEFISRDEWAAELRILYQDISDEASFAAPSTSDANSDVAVALSKVKAVYGFEKADILDHTVEDLAAHEKVSGLLGSTIKISENNANTFYQAIKSKVESTEPKRRKGRQLSHLVDSQPSTEQQPKWQVWPLIRVVRLYTKAPVLSTGVSIVDLPDVQDSNAARANIAASYLRKCSGLWVAAPITRAVDDHTAKSLLGDAFKRQVQLDGSLGSLSFICTKTYDISLTEVNEMLDINESYREECEDLWAATELLENRLQFLEEQKEEATNDTNRSMERLDVLENLRDGQDDIIVSSKRKSRCESSDGVTEDEEPMCLDSDDDNDVAELKMTQKDVENEMLIVTKRRKTAFSRKRTLETQIEDCRKQLSEAESEKSRQDRDFSRACILSRNQYAKERIQEDFAAGIRQLDQENAAVQDDNEFDPNFPIRDYEALAKSLNVFCVSAKAYQSLNRRFRGDHAVKGFSELEQTEIPQVQRYCVQATTAARMAACTNFLNSLEQFLNSVKLLSSRKDGGIELTQEKTEEDDKFLNEQLELLRKDLGEVVKNTMSALNKGFEDLLLTKFGREIDAASAASKKTVADWNKPRSKSGYLAWNTYQAICRRSGVYNTYDWNEQLSQNMLAVIGPGWEQVFQRTTPNVLDDSVETCKGHVRSFNETIESRFQGRSTYAPHCHSFTSQLRTYYLSLEMMHSGALAIIKEDQKTAHRTVSRNIQEALRPPYLKAAEARGKGTYRVMKDVMTQGVEESSPGMFFRSAESVKSELGRIIASVHTTLETKVNEIFNIISQDYRNAFEQSRSTEDKALAAELSAFLRHVSMFEDERKSAQRKETNEITTGGHAAYPAASTEIKVKKESPDTGY